MKAEWSGCADKIAPGCRYVWDSLHLPALLHFVTHASLFHLQLINKEGIKESVGQLPYGICIRNGILVAPKNAVIPDGTVI